MKKRILLIEDETDIREAMAEAIEEAGFEVVQAGDGAQGLQIAKNEKPDLILLDLIMPVMDGKETLKKLRQDEWGRNAKVIILTAMDDTVNVAVTHEHNIEDYIIKAHASLDEIVNKVRLAVHT